MHNFELFVRTGGAFGYRVYDGVRLAIEQQFAPAIGGHVPMTEAEATAYAKADVVAADEALLASLALEAPAQESLPAA